MQGLIQHTLPPAEDIKPYQQILKALAEYYFQNIKLAQDAQVQAKDIEQAIQAEKQAGRELSDTEQSLFRWLLTLLKGIGQDTLKEPKDFKTAVSRSLADYSQELSIPEDTCYSQVIEALNLTSTEDYIAKINEIIDNLQQQIDTSRLEAMGKWPIYQEKFEAAIYGTKDSRPHLYETFSNFKSNGSNSPASLNIQTFCIQPTQIFLKSTLMMTSVLDIIKKAPDLRLKEADLKNAEEIISSLLQGLKDINHSVNEHKRSVEVTQEALDDALEKSKGFTQAKERIGQSKQYDFKRSDIKRKLKSMLSKEALKTTLNWYDSKTQASTAPSKGNIVAFLTKQHTNSLALYHNLHQHLEHLHNMPILSHKNNNHRLDTVLVRPDSIAESGYGSSYDSAFTSTTSSTTSRSSLTAPTSKSVSSDDSLSIKSQYSDIGTHAVVNNNSWPRANVDSIAAQRPYSASAISLNSANPSEPAEAAHAQLASQSTHHQPTFSNFKLYNASHLTILDKRRQAELLQTTPVTLGNQGDQRSNIEEFYPHHDRPLKASRVSSSHPLAQQISELKQQISDIGQDIHRTKSLDTIDDDRATKPNNKKLKKREKNRLLLLKKLDQMQSTLTKLEPQQKPGLLVSLWQLWHLRRQLQSAIKHTEQSSASYFPNTHGRLLATDKALRSLDSTYKNSFSEYRNKSNWLGLSLSASSLAVIAITTLTLIGLGVVTAGILPPVLISAAIFSICVTGAIGYNGYKITRNNHRYAKQQALQNNHNRSIREALPCQEPSGELYNEPILPTQENVRQAIIIYGQTPAPKWASVNRVRHSQFFRQPLPVQIPNPDKFAISRTSPLSCRVSGTD